MIRRGDIRWYPFARPDKKRPVVVLTRDSILEYLGEVTVAPLTTVIREIPSEVILSESDGLPQPCAINCDHTQSVQKSRLGPLIVTLSSEKLDEVEKAITFSLGFRGKYSPCGSRSKYLVVDVSGEESAPHRRQGKLFSWRRGFD